MKIRILNGGHAIIAYPAALPGIEQVHDAMADGTIAAFVDKIETDEIVPIVPPVPGQDLSVYKQLILRRFSNPEVADTAHRLCFDDRIGSRNSSSRRSGTISREASCRRG